MSRPIVSLDGKWFVRFGRLGRVRSLQVGDLPSWSAVTVPSCLGTVFSLGEDWTGTVTCARVFRAPDLLPGQTLTATFAGVWPEPRVVLNGRQVPCRGGATGTVVADLGPGVRPGENVLLLQFERKHSEQRPLPPEPLPFGMWGPVWLEVRPKVHIAAVRVTAEADGSWEGEVRLSQEVREPRQLTLCVVDQSGRVCAATEAKIEGGDRGAFRGPKVPEVRPWSPQYPTLYRVHVRLQGEAGEQRVFSVGFRTVAVTPEGMFLNGEPFYVRCILDDVVFPGHGRSLPSVWALRKRFRTTKALRFNAVFLPGGLPDLRVARVADRVGLLLWYELPAPRRFTQRTARQLEDLCAGLWDRDGNCPSVAFVNLLGDRPFARKEAASAWAVDFRRRLGRPPFAVLGGPGQRGGWPVAFVTPAEIPEAPRDTVRIGWCVAAPGLPDSSLLAKQGLGAERSLLGELQQVYAERIAEAIGELRSRQGVHGYVVRRLQDSPRERRGLLGKDGRPRNDALPRVLGPDWVGCAGGAQVVESGQEVRLRCAASLSSPRYREGGRVRVSIPGGQSAQYALRPGQRLLREQLGFRAPTTTRLLTRELRCFLESALGHTWEENSHRITVVPPAGIPRSVLFVDTGEPRGNELARVLLRAGFRMSASPAQAQVGIFFGLGEEHLERAGKCHGALLLLEEPSDVPERALLSLRKAPSAQEAFTYLRAESALFAGCVTQRIQGSEFDALAAPYTLSGVPERCTGDVVGAYLVDKEDFLRPFLCAVRLERGAGLLCTVPFRELLTGGNPLGAWFFYRILQVLADRALRKIELTVDMRPEEVLVPTARDGGGLWRYAFSAPRTSWYLPGFEDSGWQRGRGAFGRRSTPKLVVRRTWESPDIYLRTTFTVSAVPKKLLLWLFHDGSVQVVLNGRVVLRRGGFTTDYVVSELSLDPGEVLRSEENVLAVHCHHERKAHGLDVGLIARY